MQLSVKQRIYLESALSAFTEGRYEQLKAKKSILEKIDFTTEEIQELDFKSVPNGSSVVYNWNLEKEIPRQVDFLELETTLIKEILVKLNEEARLSEQLFDIYELFVM